MPLAEQSGQVRALSRWVLNAALRQTRAWCDMGRSLAKEGYSVLVPNPFYRLVREANLDYRTFDFSNTTDRAFGADASGAPPLPC